MRLALPQPYEDLGHTADVGVRVRGATAEEALARLVLAFATLATGGAEVAAEREERVAVAGGRARRHRGRAAARLLYRLATERLVPAACEVLRADASGADAAIAFGRRDPELHAEGADLKAVTWHAARLEREGDGWVGQAVFDI
jgi:SHS2 domain-containing protein